MRLQVTDKPRRSPATPPRPTNRHALGGSLLMGLPTGYVPATRHPWPCLLFVLPMLVAYEAGVLCLGGPHPETIRNGADHWLRCALLVVGVRFFWVPPLLLSLV